MTTNHTSTNTTAAAIAAEMMPGMARQTASAEALRIVARFCGYRGYAKPLVITDHRGGHLATSLDFGYVAY
jgi:hypothetical protein